MTRLLRTGALCLLLAILGAAPAAAEAPELLSYQGVLTLTDGATVPDGDFDVVFRIFDAPMAGTLLYQKSLTVGVKDGLYNVLLSESDVGTLSLTEVFASGSLRFMELEVEDGPTAAGVTYPFTVWPRQQIASVPYALDAAGTSAVQMARDVTTRLVDPNPTPTGDSQHLTLASINTWYGPFSFSGTAPSLTVPADGNYAAKVAADVTFMIQKDAQLVFALVEQVDALDPVTVKVVPFGMASRAQSGKLRLEYWRDVAANGAAYSYQLYVTSSDAGNLELTVNPYPETRSAGTWKSLPANGPGGGSDPVAMESGITIELIPVK
jgi:hypothetical protein